MENQTKGVRITAAASLADKKIQQEQEDFKISNFTPGTSRLSAPSKQCRILQLLLFPWYASCTVLGSYNAEVEHAYLQNTVLKQARFVYGCVALR